MSTQLHLLTVLLYVASLTLLPFAAAAKHGPAQEGADALSVTRSANALHVTAPGVRLDVDLSQGLYSLHWGTQRAIRDTTGCAAGEAAR